MEQSSKAPRYSPAFTSLDSAARFALEKKATVDFLLKAETTNRYATCAAAISNDIVSEKEVFVDYRNKVLIGFVIGLIVGLFAPPTSAQVIDDFESYSTGEEMEAAWHNPSPALWNVSLDTLLPGGGVQSMRAVLVNHGGGGVSFLFPPIQGPVDLTGKVIFVWVRGDGDNPENSRAFLQLYDGTEWCNGMNRYITLDRWQQLEVDPAQCNGFNTSDVEIVSIGIGGTTGVTSDLVVNIDDLSYDGEMGSMFSDGFESGSTSAWSG